MNTGRKGSGSRYSGSLLTAGRAQLHPPVAHPARLGVVVGAGPCLPQEAQLEAIAGDTALHEEITHHNGALAGQGQVVLRATLAAGVPLHQYQAAPLAAQVARRLFQHLAPQGRDAGGIEREMDPRRVTFHHAEVAGVADTVLELALGGTEEDGQDTHRHQILAIEPVPVLQCRCHALFQFREQALGTHPLHPERLSTQDSRQGVESARRGLVLPVRRVRGQSRFGLQHGRPQGMHAEHQVMATLAAEFHPTVMGNLVTEDADHVHHPGLPGGLMESRLVLLDARQGRYRQHPRQGRQQNAQQIRTKPGGHDQDTAKRDPGNRASPNPAIDSEDTNFNGENPKTNTPGVW